MRVTVSDAKEQVTELVRRADSRRALLDAVRALASGKAALGPGAARSQDFLYGDDGLPE